MQIELYKEVGLDIGQEVYYISSRAKKNSYSKSKILGFNAKIRMIDGKPKAIVKSIDLMAITLKDDGSFPLNEVFATEEEVKAVTEFFPVTFITSEQWEQAIGTRREGGVSVERSELKPGCGDASDLRDYLYICYSRSGLIKLDRDYVETLALRNYDSYDKIPPILKNVFTQLKINFDK